MICLHLYVGNIRIIVDLAVKYGKMTAEEGNGFFSVYSGYATKAREGGNGGEEEIKSMFISTLKQYFGGDRAREIIQLVVSL